MKMVIWSRQLPRLPVILTQFRKLEQQLPHWQRTVYAFLNHMTRYYDLLLRHFILLRWKHIHQKEEALIGLGHLFIVIATILIITAQIILIYRLAEWKTNKQV
uniref:GOLD domain-containing protein n=1 Tax=Saccharomyces cerevisiae TaxID=4932 RepID=E9PA76_YEASX|nr:unknown [Saccharomyces cerevisiae]